MIKGGDTLYYTTLSGQIDGEEKPDKALLREIQEESGIVVKSHKILFEKSMNVNKTTSAIGYFFVLRITDFTIETPTGDGTAYEKASKTLYVTAERLESILMKPNVDFLLTGIYSIYKSLKG
jgi:8-oxo-dGTP pyrophosphatase MutT (NUDIX family)